MPASSAVGRLAHRGVAVLDPALLPALVPDNAWVDVPMGIDARLVEATGPRPFLLAPAAEPSEAARVLAGEDPRALLYVGTCGAPRRGLEPGDLLVVDRALAEDGEVMADSSLVAKLQREAELHGLLAKTGSVGPGELGSNKHVAPFLAETTRSAVPSGALLVCEGPEPAAGTEAPAAVLEAFDRLFGLLQEALGEVRRPVPL
jgi:hypothetical protein